ncbi:MAG: YCF48-related protein [Bacteroidota bacterium]
MSLKKHFLTIFFVICAFNLHAVKLQFQTTISGASVIAGTVGGNVQDDQYASLPVTSGFVNNKVTDYVKLAVNHQYATLVSNIYHYNVQLKIDYWDNNKTFFTTTKTLFVEYDPTAGVAYKDYATYNFSGAHRMQVTILQVTNAVTGVPVTNPEDNLVISYGVNIERYWNFTSTSTSCVSGSASDLNGDGEMDELNLSWSPISGAEEYELEWTYVDDYSNTSLASTIAASAIEYNFKYNSSRITTKDLTYKLNLIYERGYVIYRLRGVGRKLTSLTTVINGDWSVPDAGTGLTSLSCGSSTYYYTTGHISFFNWQYSSIYAEEGKKKEVVGYYDGGLRNRQTVTKVNTTDTAIVGESIYDFQGRKAIDILPVPAQSPALTYYPDFNKNMSGVKYSRDDFDKDITGQPCDVEADGMATTSGSSQYYSPANTLIAYHQSYLPDAQNFPFNQVEYTPDNTGRVRSMGGVGPDHQLGGGKETKYYYGRPVQEELDRLFGSEVGYVRHYKKNVVIDPNGQVSISYLDQEGHVIATALSGNTPGNVRYIESSTTAQTTLNADLFAKNPDESSLLNLPDIAETSLIFNTQYLVSTPGLNHTFDYDLTPETFTDPCLLESICFDCVYDLELKIRDECGVLIYSNVVRVGSLTLNNACNEIVFVPSGNAPASFTITNMELGNYQISKVLTVNKEAYDYYLTQYLDATNNTCFKSYETILEEEQVKLEGISCEDDCVSCIESLGASDNFVLTGKGTYEDWLNQYNECLEQCKSPSICEQAYETMLADMMPGGQYAEWYDSLELTGFNADRFPLSILNFNNNLPDGLASTDPNAAYWKNPKYLRRNGSESDGYFEKDGYTRSKIPVIPLQGGGYFPATTSIITVNNLKYTYPENLSNPKDFVTYWQESWAQSLVKYHPEYCYYKWCILNTMDTSGNAVKSSENFDADVQFVESYSTAVTNGWIDAGNQYAILDSDPYFNEVADGIAQYNDMKNELDDFLISGFSMKEMAAKVILCPSYYGTVGGISSGCISFGSGSTPQNDKMWEQYKSYYYSAKQKILKIAADNFAISTGESSCGKGYNGCIGSEQFNPFESAFVRYWGSAPFDNDVQPCNYNTFILYKDKKMRFSIGEHPIKGDEEKAKFNTFYKTGICPAEADLAFWLHSLASSGGLLTSNALNTHYAFTNLLYEGVTGSVSGSGYVEYTYTPTISGINPRKLEITFVDGSSVLSPCSMYLQLPSSSYTWSMVKDFTNIKVGILNTYTGTYGFSINALLDDDANPSTPDILVKVIGATCLPLGTCKFYDQCKSTDFGSRLINLMSSLANGGQMTSTSAINLETGYNTFLNRFIRNTIPGSASSDLRWKQPSSSVADFEIYDVSSYANKITISFTSFNPSFAVADLYKIKYFTNLELDPSNTQHGFYITAWYEPTVSAPLQKVIIRGTISEGKMASCYEPIPLDCETKEHQAARDLELLLNDIFTTSITPQNLSENIRYTDLLESYIGAGDHTQFENITANTSGLTAEINVYATSSAPIPFNTCNLHLFHLPTDVEPITGPRDFSNIISIEQLFADQSFQNGTKTYHFKMLANFANGEQEEVGGYTSCIPIRSCYCGKPQYKGPDPDPCAENAKATFEATILYNSNVYGNNPSHLTVPVVDMEDVDCNCLGSYINYLKSYTSTTIPPASYQTYMVNKCKATTELCPKYILYYSAVFEYNLNNPTDQITIEPLTSGFDCDCLDNYINYIKTFKLNPPPFPFPPKTLSVYASDCAESTDPTGDDCEHFGYNYWQIADNAVNLFNSLTPGSPVDPMPPYDDTIDCKCYLRYALYLTGAYNSHTYLQLFPNPAMSFAEFQAQGCVNNDCWPNYYETYIYLAEAAKQSGYVPPFEPPAYDPELCDCYIGYSWYVRNNYGPNMLTVEEWCEQNSELMSPMFSSFETETNEREYKKRTFCVQDSLSPVYAEFDDPCEVFKTNQAIYNAKKRYDDQILAMTTDFRIAYYSKCLSLTETFDATIPTKDYHYTLYYYDQAGNLVATVPPEGVQLIDLATYGDMIKEDRAAKTQTVFNEHYLKTNYEYNSLNQLKRQSVPDNDKIDVWQVDNSAGIPGGVTITDIQFVDGNKGFCVGKDATGYGYIYKTIDGGLNWIQIDPRTADVNKVQMVNSNDGFAVGDDGLFLQTTNGGINWNIVLVKITDYDFKKLNDLYFKDASNGIIVGDEGRVIKCTFSSSWTFTNINTNITSGMNVLSITPDIYGGTPSYDKMLIAVTMPAASSDINRIFVNSNVWSSAIWTDLGIKTNTRATDLNAVYMINSNDGFAAGVNGGVFKTSDGGVNWLQIATGTVVNFKRLYFKTTSQGIALANNGKLYATVNGGNTWTVVSIIGSYNDISIYDLSNGKGYAAGDNGLLAYIDFANISNGKLVQKKINQANTSQNFAGVSALSISEIYLASSGTNELLKAEIIGDKVKYAVFGTISGVTGYSGIKFASTNKGAVLTNTGKIYNCIYSGSYSFTDISHSGATYADFAFYGSSGDLYALNVSSNSVLYKTNSTWTSTMAILGSNSLTETGLALYKDNSSIIAVGALGANAKFNTGSNTWSNNSANTNPLKLRDVFEVPTTSGTTTNTVYATGDDGTLLKSTDGGSTWQMINTGTALQLNSCAFSSTTDGIVAGNNGVLLKCTGSGITLPNSYTAYNLNDVCYNSSNTKFSIVGQKLTLLQTTIASAVSVLSIPNVSGEILNGVSDIGGNLVVYGQYGFTTKYLSSSWYKCYKMPYALNAVHVNKKNGLGLTVGENGTTIYTNTMGNIWTVNKAQLVTTSTTPVFTGVSVWNADNIYTTGKAQIARKYTDLQCSLGYYSYNSTSSVDWNDVYINELGKGYIGGSNQNYAYFTATYNTSTLGTNTGAPGTYSINSISMNYDEVYFACDNNKFFKANTTTSVVTDLTSNLPAGSSNLLRYVAYDKLNGILLGAGGKVIRSYDLNGNMVFEDKSALNNNGSPVSTSLMAMDYSSRNHVVFAGASGHIKNLETDKTFTSLFWYDKLGRMTVSQNTKQYNKATKAYSYTLYDDLGRIIQVGEIAQSNSINDQYVGRQMDNSLFLSWISGGSRTEVTETWYDEQFVSTGVFVQNNIRKRVASITYEDVFDNNSATYNSATHYSYDIHGNVDHMVQEIKEAKLLATGLNIKHITYEYDLVSGKVNKVCYNVGSKDQYYHKYEYDADNRITQVNTSRDDLWWDNDAEYNYYNHGLLARTELGDLKVQGMDYAYTIHGWIKGVNSNTMQSNRDMGQDGLAGSTRQYTAKDAMGYSLGYYVGDYADVKGYSSTLKFEASTASSDLLGSRYDLWNGNIGHMVSVMPDVSTYNSSRTITPSVRGGGYKYDQLNRLSEAQSFFNINLSTNSWQSGGGSQLDYFEQFEYDAMGNITHVGRRGNGATLMDNMDYKYNRKTGSGRLISNKLYHVDDGVSLGTFSDDIDDQGTFTNAQDNTVNTLNNYGYDESGNLKRDDTEQIQDIEWTVYDKIKKVTRTSGSIKPDLEFIYDAGGNRIVKIVKPKPLNCATYKYSYYLRDVQGNEMAHYELTMKNNCSGPRKLYVTEHAMYGSSRLGIDSRKTLLYDSGVNLSNDTLTYTYRKLAIKQYELSNHLGNVLVTVSDKKIPKRILPGAGAIDYFEPDITTISDYYAFGSPMPTRTWTDPNAKYKYGFNGQESDDEIDGDDNCLMFTYRIYDSRLGRFLSQDPLFKNYADYTPYSFCNNKVISYVECGGLEGIPSTAAGISAAIAAGQPCSQYEFAGSIDGGTVRRSHFYNIDYNRSWGLNNTLWSKCDDAGGGAETHAGNILSNSFTPRSFTHKPIEPNPPVVVNTGLMDHRHGNVSTDGIKGMVNGLINNLKAGDGITISPPVPDAPWSIAIPPTNSMASGYGGVVNVTNSTTTTTTLVKTVITKIEISGSFRNRKAVRQAKRDLQAEHPEAEITTSISLFSWFRLSRTGARGGGWSDGCPANNRINGVQVTVSATTTTTTTTQTTDTRSFSSNLPPP